MVRDYTPNCRVDALVVVNGTQVPATNVDIHVRKEGPAYITRYAEAEFASPYNGEDYVNLFGTSRPDDQSELDTVRIDVLDTETRNYYPTFRGIVTGLGNPASSDDPQDQDKPGLIWKLRAQGPGHFLDRLPISATFDRPPSGLQKGAVLRRVYDEINDTLPLQLTNPLPEESETEQREKLVGDNLAERNDLPEDAIPEPDEYYGVKGTEDAAPVKTFQKNKHTVADVLDWISDKSATRSWLVPAKGGIRFVSRDDPNQRTHKAHTLGGDLRVVNNDALRELRPVNTITVNGAAKRSRGPIGTFQVQTPPKEFVAVTARHRSLYERAGKKAYHADVTQTSDAQTKQEVQQEARSLLKQKIDETTGGDMTALLRAPISPSDLLVATPACDGSTATDLPPLTYEIARVRHQIRSGISKTTINVGPHTDPRPVSDGGDIEIVDTWTEELNGGN